MFFRARGRHRQCPTPRRVVAPLIARALVPAACVAALALTGVVTASAAGLGGVSASQVGAAEGAVRSHTAGVTVTWQSALVAGAWVVDGITLVTQPTEPFLAGEWLRLAVIGSSGAQLCQIEVEVMVTSASVAIDRTTVDAACGVTPFTSVNRIAVSATR